MKIVKEFKLLKRLSWKRNRIIKHRIITLNIDVDIQVAEGEVLKYGKIVLGRIENVETNVDLQTKKNLQTVKLASNWWCEKGDDEKLKLKLLERDIEEFKTLKGKIK